MMSLKDQAIQTALLGDWETAIELNHQLLSENDADIDSLNRLGFAYTAIGNIKEAKNTYQKVLAIDTKNPIALKNLKRLQGLSSETQNSKSESVHATMLSSQHNIGAMFLEENGKTKVVELVNVAESKILAGLRTGSQLAFSVKRSKIFVLDSQKQYVGMLPDDIAHRLIRFLEGGNQYEVYVKSIQNRKIAVFIREIKRAQRFKDQPSFVALGAKITPSMKPSLRHASRA